jgi:mono/diheme cytochrome c family protein
MTSPTGESLYMSYCIGCHGSADPKNMLPPPNAPRKVIGAWSCSIKGAIYGTYVFPDGVSAMQFMQNAFSADQIQMIADYLNSFFDGITGNQRYTTTCAGCHGLKARGGRVDEDVRGEDAEDIKEAIYDERPMRFLTCLPSFDIYDIGYYVEMIDDDDDGDDDDGDDDDDD